jgi:L-ribulose-5-phosphate 4-epimerase
MNGRLLCKALREELLAAALRLPEYGLVWMAGGTACARDPETGYVITTPSGLKYDQLTPEDMVVVDMELKVIEGHYRPSVATNLWIEMFKRRDDVNAIIHTHSPYATAFSVINEPIPIITETQANWFRRPIQVARYAHVEDEHFVSAPADAMGDGFAVLLGQHGPVVVGKNLDDALERAVTLEEAAKTCSIARLLGKPIPFTEAQAERSYDYYTKRYGQK